jgi:isoquinoline 1-oxidoreductase beta subunit
MAGQDLSNWMRPDKKSANWGTTEGFANPYFKTIKNISFTDIPFETPVPPLWWRSVYASTNGFAYESFMDELALATGKDPMAFRRQYLDDERMHQLIDQLAAMSGWSTRKKKSGYGVAIVESFGSTVGQVVKVSKPASGKLKIDKVWAVIDCGWYVNPDTIRAQVEGAIVMALGAATQHAMTFKDGKAEHTNFHTYPVTRISETPPIEVHIMDNDAKAGGVGEPGLPPFAPALANAIFDLTGKRIRKLPMNLATV